MTLYCPIKLFFALCFTALLLIAFPIYVSSQSKELPKGKFSYKETVGNSIIPFSWMVEPHGDDVIVKVFEEDKSFFNICSTNGATLKWHIKNKNKHNIIAERIGNTITISGMRFGKPYSKTVEIDDRPWYQPLSYSLGNFLDSGKESTSFWVVRADTIEVVPLTAEKIGEEDVSINGMKILSKIVEVRVEGFKSRFWHATYWYRKSDNLFVRYRSVHGLPGTDETIVELVKSPSGRIGS